MEAKFTPGPWQFHARLSGSENHRGFRIFGPGASGWALAEVMPVDADGKEGHANASLMAAATDLLEACGMAVGLLKLQRDLIEQGKHADAWNPAIRMLQAAIDKATGSAE